MCSGSGRCRMSSPEPSDDIDVELGVGAGDIASHVFNPGMPPSRSAELASSSISTGSIPLKIESDTRRRSR